VFHIQKNTNATHSKAGLLSVVLDSHTCPKNWWSRQPLLWSQSR